MLSMLKEDEELPEHMAQELPQHLVKMEKDAPTRMFNPFLELKGYGFFLVFKNDPLMFLMFPLLFHFSQVLI